MEKHLDPLILLMAEKQSERGGFTIDMFEPGTKLTVETCNSIYQIEIVDGYEIMIMGGVLKDGNIRFPDPINGSFVGSTWGSSILKPHWFGKGMCMEIRHDGGQVLTTSPLKNARIELPSGREFDLKWNETD